MRVKKLKKGLLIVLAFLVAFTLASNETYASSPPGTSTNSITYNTEEGGGTVTISWPSKIYQGEDLPVTFTLGSSTDLKYLFKVELEEWAISLYIYHQIAFMDHNGGGLLYPGDSVTIDVNVNNTIGTDSISISELSYYYNYTDEFMFPDTETRYNNDRSVNKTLSFEVSSYDTTPPIFSGSLYYYSDVDNPATLADIKSEISANDETDGNVTSSIEIHSDPYTGNEGTLGEYHTVWKAVDSSGNIGYTTVRVRVVDVTDPVITLHGSSTIYIEYGGSFTEPGYSVSDNYDTVIGVNITGDTINTNQLGTYYRYYNSTDDSGNTATQRTRTIIVEDTTKPVISITGSSTVYVEVGSSYTDAGATWSDAVDGSGSANASGTVNTSALGSYTITYSYTDSSGNSAYTKTRTVVVQDTAAPTLSLNGDSTVYVGLDGTYTEQGATYSDNVDGSGSAVPSGTVDTTTLGTYTITYNYTDSSGNSATPITRTVIVEDQTKPTLTLNGDSTIYVEYNGTYSELGAVFNDNVDGTGSAVPSGTVDTSILGTYTITYSYTDANGNVADTITRTVIVEDSTKPVLTLNGDSTVYVGLDGTYTESGASWTDNYDGSGSAVVTGTVDTTTLGSYTITYSYTDSNGNVADTITRTVVVEDQTKPILTLNGDSTIYLEYNGTYSELGAVFNDNVDGTGQAVASGTVDTSTLGSYTITYSYTDANGNVADTITRTVIVEDSTVPTIILIGNPTIYVEYGDTYTENGASWTDNYDGSGQAVVSGNVDETTLGTYTVTYTYTDSNGNIAEEVTRTVIVQDTTAPEVVGDLSQIITYNSLDLTLAEVITNIRIHDEYDGDLTANYTVTTDNFTPANNAVGTYSVTITVTDSNGNTLTHTFDIDIRDDVAPTFSGSSYLLTETEANAMTQEEIKAHIASKGAN